MSERALSRREKQANTRRRLLASAARLFSCNGLDGASVDDVVKDAGYTKGAFYSNFKSKEELFLVMLDEKFAAELERVDRELASAGDPGEEARGAATELMRVVHSDPDWPRLYLAFAAHAARDADFREELATRHRALRERMTVLFDRWAAGFDVEPPIPTSQVAAMIFFASDGFILDQLIDPELGDELYATLMQIVVTGLGAMAYGWEPPES